MSRVAGAAFSSAQSADAVEAGHGHVEHDRVGARGRDPLLRGHGVGGLVDLDVDSLERRAQQRAQRVVVVDQQEAQS